MPRRRKKRNIRPNAAAVIAWRESRGLTQEEFAAELREWYLADRAARESVALSTIKRIEQGVAVRPKSVRAIAAFLECPVVLLLDAREARRWGNHGVNTAQAPSLANLESSIREFERRFHQLVVDYRRDVRGGLMTGAEYWQLFWYLQIDQFLCWRRGALERETYRFWLCCRRRDYVENEAIGEVEYRVGWQRARAALQHPGFAELMDMAHDDRIDGALDRFAPAAIEAKRRPSKEIADGVHRDTKVGLGE